MEINELNELYDPGSLEVMRSAEEAYVRGSNRLEEIRNYARSAGVRRIGIAHCVSMPREAAAVGKFLSDDFEVFSIDCKCGRVTKQELLGGEGNSIMCNPAGQAAFLKEQKTELNISMGLCVGHDMLFNQKSEVAVTTLVVKDRVNHHNPIEGIRSVMESANTSV